MPHRALASTLILSDRLASRPMDPLVLQFETVGEAGQWERRDSGRGGTDA